MNKWISLLCLSIVLAHTIMADASLSLNEAITLALKNKQVENFKLEKAMASDKYKLAQDIYDTQIDIGTQYASDQSQSGSSFAIRAKGQDVHASLSKKIPTGTQIKLHVSTGEQDITYGGSIPEASYNESKLGITLTQQLLKNGLGYQDKNTIQIQTLDQTKETLLVLNKVEALLQETIQFYWQLVLANKVVETTKEAADNAKTLFEVHQTKLKSGITEAKTLYALEADYLQRQNEYETAVSAYKSLNRKFQNFLELETPLTLTKQTEMIMQWLTPKAVTLNTVQLEAIRSVQIETILYQQETLRLQNSLNNRKPNLSLVGGATYNGTGDTLTESGKEALSLDHLHATVALNMTLPDLSTTKINIQKHEKTRRIQENKIDLIKTEKYLAIQDAYDTVKRLEKEKDRTKKIETLLTQKYKEDLNHFNLGRIQVDELLRSQNALTQSKLNTQKTTFNYITAVSTFYYVQNALLDKITLITPEGDLL